MKKMVVIGHRYDAVIICGKVSKIDTDSSVNCLLEQLLNQFENKHVKITVEEL